MPRDAGMRRPVRLERLAVAILAMGVSAGCGRRAPPEPPPVPPAPTAPAPLRPLPGYEARVDSLDAVDPAALVGRRVAIDAGHGGRFPGSIGVNGLTEAAVNLDVALRLESLLVARGAQVMLTRRDDRDFLTPADSSLSADLAERARLANAFRPDLLVSIHHNADPGGARDKNETQTYYKLGDEGPSLEAAASLHRFLRRNLGIEKHRILPGNYFVLRTSAAPAVLTEASYLTNPDVEARLAQAEKRRLEAEALYLGIAHFFSRPAPAIEVFEAASGAAARADTAFAEVDAPLLRARLSGAFDQVSLRLDGEPVDPLRVGNRIEWRSPTPLGVGSHEAALRVSLSGVGSSRERRLAFRLTRRPSRLRAALVPESAAGGGARAVRIEVLDRSGLPLPDSLRIRVRGVRPGVSPAETVVTSRDGVAWAYVRLPSVARTRTGALLRVALAGPPSAAVPAVAVEPGPSGAKPRWTGWAIRMPGGGRLEDAPGTREPKPVLAWLNRDGFAALEPDSAGRAAAPSLRGYRFWGGSEALPPRFTAVAGGILHGRRVVVDPDGGGEDGGGMGPSGTRASFHNMDVARALASLLTAAGAEVRLARAGDYAASDVERVRLAEAFGAERYLRIGHRPEPPRLGYYYSSAAGRKWADRTARWLLRLGLAAPPPAEDAQYVIQQSSCPALHVAVGRVDDPGDEERMNAPGAARVHAYALFLALAEEWAGGSTWPLDSLHVRGPEGAPLPGVLATLGGALTLETDALGRVRFARTEPGPLEVILDHRGARSRVVLQDSERGVILQGPPRP